MTRFRARMITMLYCPDDPGQTPEGRASGAAAGARRRAHPGGQKLTASMIQEAMDAADYICPYCGDPFKDGHIDHIIPVSQGGTNDRENLVYCCAFCNMSKGARMLEDWLVVEAAVAAKGEVTR